MLSDIIGALACPVCGADLALDDGVIRCGQGHSFDIARQGYVNLLHGRAQASTADTPEMIAARQRFLDSGVFEAIVTAVVEAARAALPEATPGVLLDVGAGTGHYLAALIDAFPERAGVALDVSKHAARVAARSHDRVGAIVADAWGRLPLHDDAAALVLVAFSPRNAEEFARVLAAGGVLIVVTPNPEHLGEIVGPLGLISIDPRKGERLAAKLGGLFELTDDRCVQYEATLDREAALSAVLMGPSAAHHSAEYLAGAVGRLPERLEVTISVTVGTYRLSASDTRSA